MCLVRHQHNPIPKNYKIIQKSSFLSYQVLTFRNYDYSGVNLLQSKLFKKLSIDIV